MEQPYLKKWGLVLFIAMLSMIPPLATDLYMPALPEMVDVFHTTTTMTSFTMTIFFVFMAIGILIFGPLSDKFGRKPVLVFSIGLTLICSIGCAFSPTILILIITRAIQALGAGGMVAIATALVKDSFVGNEMSQVLSITQAMSVLAPMLAPIIGAIIITRFDWSKTFIALAVINLISLILALLLKEPLTKDKRTNDSIGRSIWSITKVLKNKTFTSYFLIGGILTAPFMSYIAVASYVYINNFGISQTAFSIYFAITAAFTILGPLLFMRFGMKSFKSSLIIVVTAIFTAIALMLTIGHISPVLFLISFIPFAVAASYFRPMISNLILQAQSTNIGAASAMMHFGFTLMGSLAMFIGSQKWSSYITGIAITILCFATVALSIVFFTVQRKWIRL